MLYLCVKFINLVHIKTEYMHDAIYFMFLFLHSYYIHLLICIIFRPSIYQQIHKNEFWIVNWVCNLFNVNYIDYKLSPRDI